MKRIITMVCLFVFIQAGYGQKNIDPQEIHDKMQWFGDAKLGIFIHADIYAVNGVTDQ